MVASNQSSVFVALLQVLYKDHQQERRQLLDDLTIETGKDLPRLAHVLPQVYLGAYRLCQKSYRMMLSYTSNMINS